MYDNLELSVYSNRKISRRIKRPPSQCAGIEMAVGISIMVLEFYISGAHSPGEKIPPKPHPSGSAQVRCAGAKPGSGRDPGHSPLWFQSGCRSQHWTGHRADLVAVLALVSFAHANRMSRTGFSSSSRLVYRSSFVRSVKHTDCPTPSLIIRKQQPSSSRFTLN